MKKSKSLYHGHRFPAGVISCAVRGYFRFQLSLRDIEERLTRGVSDSVLDVQDGIAQVTPLNEARRFE